MWTYKIIKETVKQDPAYADYLFDVFYNNVKVRTHTMYSLKISELDKTFAAMTDGIPNPFEEVENE